MTQKELVLPFTLNDAEVNGRIVKLDIALDTILNQHQYPDAIATILGELLIIASLIGSQLKDDALLSLQLQIKDTTQYIVADFQSPGSIRSYAQCNDASYEEILDQSILIVTIDRKNNQRYQGMVDVSNLSISAAMETYFYQSEQINTSIKLKLGKILLPQTKESWCGGGIMIQRLPLKSNQDVEKDSWNEAKLYFSTLRDDELLDPNLPLETLLYSVYNEMEVKIYEPIAIKHQCRCSRERVEKILESLGFDEVISIMINDKISVNCQFCNQNQDFTHEDINKMFEISS